MATYMETLRRVMDGTYESATPEEKAEAIREVMQVCSVAAAAVAIQPFPLLDAVLISPIQIAMVQAIGKIHNYKLDQKSILEILSAFGASLVTQNLIMAASKFVPFVGWVVGPSMAYALTWAVGDVSDYYFRNGRGVSQDDLQTMFKKVYNTKKAEKEEANKANTTLKEKITQLNEAFAAGLITEEEYKAEKEALLAAF
jgi:uncharacterized protein (DUF697 family)